MTRRCLRHTQLSNAVALGAAVAHKAVAFCCTSNQAGYLADEHSPSIDCVLIFAVFMQIS
jgi:hypothetical protein